MIANASTNSSFQPGDSIFQETTQVMLPVGGIQSSAFKLKLPQVNSIETVVASNMASNWGTLNEFLSPSSTYRADHYENRFENSALGQMSKPTISLIQELTRSNFHKETNNNVSSGAMSADNGSLKYRNHQASISNLVSPNFLSQIKNRFDDGQFNNSYVFKPMKKIIVRQGASERINRSLKSKSTQATTNNTRGVGQQYYQTTLGAGTSIFDDSLMMSHNEAPAFNFPTTTSNGNLLTRRRQGTYYSSTSVQQSPRVLEKEVTYNPLKLPIYETYTPLDKESYISSLQTVKPKVGSIRKPTKNENDKKRKFIEDEDLNFQDNPLYDSKAANSSTQRSNNLYKIKLKVDQQMKINTDATKREQAHSSRPTEGPLSKDNYDRFNFIEIIYNKIKKY